MSDNKTTDTISMHFRHSTTVDELVNKLRAHYVWNEKDDLPEWIAEPLKDFPLLASYAQTLLQTLRSIPTSFGDQEATEYDLLVNCMITDQIMTSLREFELHYRAAHPVPDSEYKSANTISSYMHWLFPAARKKPPLPQQGSAIVFFGSGRRQATIALMSGRGVKYCPAPLFTSSAFFCSNPS